MNVRETVIEALKDNREDSASDFKLSRFTLSLSVILASQALWLLSLDMPTIISNGIESGGTGQPIKDVEGREVVRVLCGYDVIRNMSLFQQTIRFLNWLLNQEVPEGLTDSDGCSICWYDLEFVNRMWNEFVDEKKNR